MIRIPVILISLLLALSGCERAAIYTPVEVKIPVSIPCKAEIPAKPRSPLALLSPDAGILAQTRAALAEIELRKGYESRLLAALKACTAE